MTQETNPISTKETVFAKALTTMLKPLVRLLIAHNITYVGVQSLLKRTFVQVAESAFKLPNKKQTDSRISLLTGIHRGDVKRIREEIDTKPTEKEVKASLGAQLMSVWMGHQAYLDDQGNPCRLFRNRQDGSPSFEALVQSVSKDKHPRSVLDEWLSQNVVSITEDGMIELNEKGYVPEEDFEEKLFFAGKNIGSHLSVVASNLENEVPPMFDRAIYYHQLTPESVETLERLSKEKMMAVLTEMNRLASELQQADQQKDKATESIHLGAYFYRDDTTEE
ncbi:MAG: DUF6502 family protein [Hydrogenovibrio sp.]|nr:DUF6502 family protein [Hydrogenovibrio sp.]